MKRRVYYRMEMKLASPLSIGSGKDEKTDHDVVRGKDGKPYIPASAIAGVFRHTLDDEPDLQKEIFGYVSGSDSRGSCVVFYDASLITESVSGVRDSVKLEGKVGVDGAKFDMEIIETGASFAAYIEIIDKGEETDSAVEKMIFGVKSGSLRFGTKTSRGYGRIKLSSLKKRTFNIENAGQLDQWLDFDVFDEAAWSRENDSPLAEFEDSYTKVTILLESKGAVSIREYSTDVGENGETLPDYKHISLKDGTSVIPGTSWAGAFRSRYREFAGEDAAKALFGFVETKKNQNNTADQNKNDDGTAALSARSRIIFTESEISNNKMKTITRNSIDRFSAATKETALYTERTSYNGTAALEIMLSNDVTNRERAVLSAVILDLHNGFLSVGGLTAVGRGMFQVLDIKVNGDDRTDILKSGNAAKLLAEVIR